MPIQQRATTDLADFKVHKKTYMFTILGEMDFIDLSEKIQEEVYKFTIKNGVVHVFAPTQQAY